MLVIHLPEGHPPTGRCTINFREAEYRLTDNAFAFRYAGDRDWDTRRVEAVLPGGDLVGYVCGDSDE